MYLRNNIFSEYTLTSHEWYIYASLFNESINIFLLTVISASKRFYTNNRNKNNSKIKTYVSHDNDKHSENHETFPTLPKPPIRKKKKRSHMVKVDDAETN